MKTLKLGFKDLITNAFVWFENVTYLDINEYSCCYVLQILKDGVKTLYFNGWSLEVVMVLR
jgi:hypothetical protein